MKRALLYATLIAFGCSNDGDDDSATPCTATIQAQAGAVQADGSVTVYGSVDASTGAATPDAGSAAPATATELAVYAVYVADVTAIGSGFNFETWTASVDADHLAAFTTTGSGGVKSAKLPVVAYLHGGCVVSAAAQPVVQIPAGSGSSSG